MLRSLAILGVAAAVSAAIPYAYRSNPQAFAALFGTDKPAAEAQTQPAKRQAAAPVAESALADATFDGRRVRIPADGRGHYVASFRINGARIEGVVDTGATMVAINRSTARRIGLNLTQADFIHEVGTANGRTRAAAATLREIEIGRIRVTDVQVAVLEDRALSTTLVGMSFLNRLKRFEAARGELLLEQ